MARGFESGTRAAIAIALVVAAFVGITVASDALLRRARVDLTEDRLFTVSDGTARILASMTRPVTFTFYYSESLGRGNPGVQAYAKRVTELLEEFRVRSRGKITIERVEPETFSSAEDRALRDGMRGVQMAPGEVLYLGLVVSNDTDGREVIPFFDPTQERFLEYDLARAITLVENPDRPKVFLIAGLPVMGEDPAQAVDLATARPWLVMQQLRSVFDVRVPSAEFTAIDEDTDVLLVIHPQDFSEAHRNLIEDHIRAGRPTIIAIDPMCEADAPPDMRNPLAVLQHDRASNLAAILAPLGVKMTEGMVVGDLQLAVRAPDARGRGEVPYLQYLTMRGANIASDEPMLHGVNLVNVGTAGSLEFDDSKGTTFTPLLWTTDQSCLFESTRYELLMDPQGLLTAFQPSGREHVVAGVVRGSPSPGAPAVNVVVLADVDMLSDPLWVRESITGMGQPQLVPVANNADLLANAVDVLAGSAELLTVRARGTYARPFTLVERIRRDAEAKFLTRAQELQAHEQGIELRLASLLRDGGGDPTNPVLTPKLQEEYDRLIGERLRAREDLREVRYNLRKDVERLGTRVQVINTVAAPAAVAVGALGLGAYRAARRRADRRSMAGQG
jgi:ABC-type uncharacterized transport system involved in gliding motility auxiliary subunit